MSNGWIVCLYCTQDVKMQSYHAVKSGSLLFYWVHHYASVSTVLSLSLLHSPFPFHNGYEGGLGEQGPGQAS